MNNCRIFSYLLLVHIFLPACLPLFAVAWTDPGALPPDGNVAKPINVGSVSQFKNGTLGVNILNIFGGSQYLSFGDTTGPSAPGIRFNPTNGILEFSNGGGTWLGFNSSASQWLNVDSNIYYSDGYVSIGSNNPRAKLDVVGGTEAVYSRQSADGAYTFLGNSGTYGRVGAYSTAGGWQNLILAEGGSVGIGTTDPSSKLEIKTDALGSVTTPNSGLSLTNTTAAADNAQQMSPLLRWMGQGWASTGAASQTDSFAAHLLPVQGSTTSSANLIFSSSINGSAYTPRLTLTSAGALTTTGGISATTGGFTGPVSTTQTLTTIPTNGFAASSSSAAVSTPVRMSPSVIWSGSAWNTTPTAGAKANAVEAYLLPSSGNTTFGSLVFANRTVNGVANTTELMRLTTGGNVGIGTASPGEKLSVAGVIESASGGIKFPDGTIQTTAASAGASVNVGAGTSLTTSLPQNIATNNNDNGNLTTISWDNEEYDDAGWHTSWTNASRVSVTFSTRYHVSAGICFNTYNNGGMTISVFKNGENTYKSNSIYVTSSGPQYGATGQCVQTGFDITLNSGDYLELKAATGTGAAVNTQIDGTFFQVHVIK